MELIGSLGSVSLTGGYEKMVYLRKSLGSNLYQEKYLFDLI